MMLSSVVSGLESLAAWRAEVDRGLLAFARVLRSHELDGASDMARLAAVRERLASDRIVVAFVAEFSRGKSELINAIFFADAGRRILPATPGRTTMCPVELRFEAGEPSTLALLPIETRLQGLSLAEMRHRRELWQHVPLATSDPEALSHALREVTRVQRVDTDKARALGFGEADLDEPDADGTVEVPAWRHAIINHPHPLLQRGLVVIDTPGLNAIGAEPELTLGLLPSAHATVFLLGADTGVTKSDLSVWCEHLTAARLERFVVLNKIDTLLDPLLSADEVQAQIRSQCESTAHTLDLPVSRVFPLSARDALAARVAGDEAELRRSRLPELEAALARELMPRQRELLAAAAKDTVQALQRSAQRQIGDRRRQCAEQLLELRGLRGKSSGKLQLLQRRLDEEASEFEGCTARLAALRAVQARMLAGVMSALSSDTLRREVSIMQGRISQRSLLLGAKGAFAELCSKLRQVVKQAAAQTLEMQQMLEASSRKLNTDYGFAIAVVAPPSLSSFDGELERVEAAYGQFLSLTQVWRLGSPVFREQFRRMLLSKLRVVFENAASEIELWSKSISGPMDQQLRERRQAFVRRRESLERIAGATGGLESRIAEVEQQDQRLLQQLAQMEAAAAQALAAISPPPPADLSPAAQLNAA